jgi:uncharacterized coiled-coil protein SlyX
MNEYWEKYKHRNKSQDLKVPEQVPNVSNQIILSQISSMQNKLNSLEDRMMDLNCKYNNLSSFEPQSFLEKIRKFESILDLTTSLEHRISTLEDHGTHSKFENLKKEISNALSQTELHLSEYLDQEISKITKKLKDFSYSYKDKAVKFSDENKNETNRHQNFSDWQKKIEKIVLFCAENLKEAEKNPKTSYEKAGNSNLQIETLQNSFNKFKKVQNKLVEKLDELESFSKRMCKRFIVSEGNEAPYDLTQNNSRTPNKINPLERKKKTTKKKNLEDLNDIKTKEHQSNSVSPTNRKSKKNKLDKIYGELKYL